MSANVLVQTAFLGDLLLSIPLMKRMKSLWPQQKLILVCRRGVGAFFRETGLVDDVLEIKKGHADSYKAALAAIQKEQIEVVISPHESLRTAFFVRQIKASKKVGFSKPWNFVFYNRRVLKNPNLPDSIRQLSLLAPFDSDLAEKIQSYTVQGKPYEVDGRGLMAAPPDWASVGLQEFYRQHRAQAEEVLKRFGISMDVAAKSVALFPGSVWATKRWTEEGFVKAGKALAAEGLPVLVMGGPGEEELCARVSQKIPESQDLCGKTSILESALVLSSLAAAVGNDSASMHLAATSETPSVVIFGPTVIEFGFRPWQNKAYLVDRKGLPCRPCGKHGHHECPLGTHECMKSISAQDVLAKLKELV